METVNNVMLIYAYDTQNDGTELGPGSKERLDAGIKYILESEYPYWIIILGAGHDPSRPEKPALKTMMEHYIEQQLKEKFFSKWRPTDFAWSKQSKNIALIVSEVNTWGSWGETLRAIQTLFKNYKGRIGYYYAVSADFHLPRINLIWLMLGLPLPKTIGTPWKPIWKERVLEPVKMVKVILLGMLHWIKIGH